MFTSSTEREIRLFHVIVLQRRQRNAKKSDACTSCYFPSLNLLLFCRSSLPSPSSLLIIKDGDASENVAEKVNSRSLNLHLREITVFMALADTNYLFFVHSGWTKGNLSCLNFSLVAKVRIFPTFHSHYHHTVDPHI